MGASEWHNRVPYVADLAEALLAAKQQTLAAGDFVWDDDPFEPDASRPTTLTEVEAAKETEEFWEMGTHSILDLETIATPGSDPAFAITPLATHEVMATFGSATPTGADLDRLHSDPDFPLVTLLGERWSGRCVTLHDETGRPSEIFFWGFSGD